MITWMQRHKKYLIVTIWISTIAFVGAGFVGWGQYSYGDKAGSVAKVGDVEITMGELQKSYSRLYNQYNQMFQGDFDEERAKSFGLQAQALSQLTDQALLLNLAAEYDLEITDTELLDEIKTQDYFFVDGVFDKETYKQTLANNNLTLKEYESDVRKQLLIQKVISLLPVVPNENEANILNTIMNIADKINYKVLSDEQIVVDTSDASLKPYWEKKQQNFMSEVSYEVKYIKQEKISKTYDEDKIKQHYSDNKTHFKDSEGKILPLADAKEAVIAELNAKATKDAALRTYIAYKKGKLGSDVKIQTTTISASSNPYNADVLKKISTLSVISPYMKPVLVGDDYYTFELIKTNPSVPKRYEQAKQDVLQMYVAEQKKNKLYELAQNSLATFKGTTTDFITNRDAVKLTNMNITDANEFLIQLFMQTKKRGIISLENGNVVLYTILEQKLLDVANENQDETVSKIKSAMFNEGLINNLKSKYQTEIFIQGL